MVPSNKRILCNLNGKKYGTSQIVKQWYLTNGNNYGTSQMVTILVHSIRVNYGLITKGKIMVPT